MKHALLTLDEIVNVPPNTKTIGEMASRYEVTLRTLRFYEERGLLAPLRVGTSRFYSPRDELKLQLIHKGRRLGFSLTEIEKLLFAQEAPEAEAVSVAEHIGAMLSKEQIAEKIAHLEKQKSDIEEMLRELTQQHPN